MKLKRMVATILVAISMVSSLCIPASAINSDDTSHYYYWSNSVGRYKYTDARKKEDISGVYMHVTNNSLPSGGFYAATFYGSKSTNVTSWASASEYLVNNYKHYVIKSNGTSVSMKNKYVRIRGHYKDTTYSWGDCTIVWSPDTTSQSGLVYLN